MEAVVTGLVCACSFLFLLIKMDIRKVLGYDAVVDILFTLTIAFLMSDTYAGVSAAMIGGLTLSVQLVVVKKLIGAEKFNWRTRTWYESAKGILHK